MTDGTVADIRNPAVEAQAIDRVHRLGQKYPVQAVRLMIENSIEERLQKIQEKKANLANFALKKMTRAELLEAKVSPRPPGSYSRG